MDNTVEMKEKLAASIFEVLEKMFFVFLEPAEGRGRFEGHSAVIGFRGPMCGRLEMFSSPGVSSAMVRNMLNIEGEVSGPMLQDGLKEAINMICGNFLRKHDPSKVFDLQIPSFREATDIPGRRDPAPGEEIAAELAFVADGGSLDVVLFLDRA